MRQEVFKLLKVYLAHNLVEPEALSKLLKEFCFLDSAPHSVVSIAETVTDDYVICLEDGRKMKILKRHLQQTYGMTPEEYRKKWNLPDDYPMVAKNYAKQRSEIAREQGLGKRAV